MRAVNCLIASVVLVGAVSWLGSAAVGADTKPTTQPTTKPIGAKPIPTSQLLDSLLKPQSAGGQPLMPIQEGPVMDATTGKGAVSPGAPQMNLAREGTYVVDRTGRLTRGSDGQTAEITFDADGKTMKDPPMVVLPNLKLMQMENAVTGSSRDVRFRITGMVTEYKGRNHLLLEKVVVIPDVTQQF